MRLSKTNPGGLIALKTNIFNGLTKRLEVLVADGYKSDSKGRSAYWFAGFNQSHRIKITKSVYENSQLIDVESLSDMVKLETTHRDFVILYHVDKLAYVRKVGKEVAFVVVDTRTAKANGGAGILSVFGNYNFISASFAVNDDGIEHAKELLRILIYLFYGDVTTRFIKAKEKARISMSVTILNDSPAGIWYANSLWRQRINVSGFKVRGHFRMQPIGEGRQKRKLIWIEDFEKLGYNRRATIEILKDKK